jgi:hypothetical protein
MTSDDFARAVVAALARILSDNADLTRLNLAPDIVNGWRGYLDTKSESQMIALVREVATSNKVPLDDYERSQDARTAAEMILYAVDGFYRKSVTHTSN